MKLGLACVGKFKENGYSNLLTLQSNSILSGPSGVVKEIPLPTSQTPPNKRKEEGEGKREYLDKVTSHH